MRGREIARFFEMSNAQTRDKQTREGCLRARTRGLDDRIRTFIKYTTWVCFSSRVFFDGSEIAQLGEF